ncbi:MAG: hypothetical protein V1887_00845, partial [Candidatus Aenigmatarchaeota archaeon]
LGVSIGRAAYRRHQASVEMEFMQREYVGFHQQLFGGPPDWNPPSRAVAVDFMVHRGLGSEATNPAYAMKCYQLALWTAQKDELRRMIDERMKSLGSGAPQAQQPQQLSEPQQPSGPQQLPVKSGRQPEKKPYWLDLKAPAEQPYWKKLLQETENPSV